MFCISVCPSRYLSYEASLSLNFSVFSVPLVALSRAGTANYFTDFAFDTPHVFPVLFAVIGVLTAWELYRRKKN